MQDRIVVEPLVAEEKTAGGVLIPGTAQDKPSEGKVVGGGNGYRGKDGARTAPAVSKGDRVLFGKWSGTEIKMDGKDLLVMHERDVLPIIEGNAPARARAAAPMAAADHADHHHIPGTDCCDD